MNGDDRKWMGRIETKIENVHDDVKECKRWNRSIQTHLNTISTETALNTNYRGIHSTEHKNQFNKLIAVLGITLAGITIIVNILINLIFTGG